MPPSATPPLFSVILPTRNRPALFATALRSVRRQTCTDLEIIVVNDGSLPEHEAAYDAITAATDGVRVLKLVHTPRGHGPSYAVNFGADHARGTYLCFLDDDDEWIDPEHLSRIAAVIAASPAAPDIVLGNQQAYLNGAAVDRVVWIEDLEQRLHRAPDSSGSYVVSVGELLACKAHCHMNTMIVARELYLATGGMDEGLRYECEREFYLRAIDRAGSIRFVPQIVARHNIPDPAARVNLSTSESEFSRRLYQLRVFDKIVLFSGRPELRRYAMQQRAYVLQHIATEAARVGRFTCAARYGLSALAAKFSPRWLATTIGFVLKQAITRTP